MNTLEQWANRHGVSVQALDELRGLMGARTWLQTPPTPAIADKSEAWATSMVRIEAARMGVHLWRNNVGALMDSRGVPVRFGLLNESPALNKRIKSADWVGIRPLRIEHHHVGMVLGQFIAREIKRPGWTYTGTGREPAQLEFLQLVRSLGGDAAFATGAGTL